MLNLQRASAGSGKTYTLAKKYIWYLIAVKINGRWRLRTKREIADGLPRILAITFTNKATAEMKQRIIDKLAALADADGRKKIESDLLRKTDYLKEFYEELTGEDPLEDDFHYESTLVARQIGEAAREALSILLNDYSDFKVSTIDSFFQTVLRTFAYEANLNDSYQVEIDNEYVTNTAIDLTLESLNSRRGKSPASFWIGEIVKGRASEGYSGWNVFQKSTSKDSVYTSLRNAMRNLESEEFKEVRTVLDDYFDSEESSRRFIDTYLRLRKDLEGMLKDAAKEAAMSALSLRKAFEDAGIDIKECGHQHLESHILKLQKLDIHAVKAPFTSYGLSSGKSLYRKTYNGDKPELLMETALRMYDAYDKYLSLKESPKWRHWVAYSRLMPYLGLIGETRMRMQEFLDTNNTIQLGETNSMLRRIIGEDDAPFVYERIGGSINHYLVDEFQDTSRLQWENMLPLLSESDSRGEDNLIIGDAKQSIYRFRNADPTLITEEVPMRFPDGKFTGDSKAENTNWRSSRRIVEFNNYFFKELIEKVSNRSKGIIDFQDLYSNVAQYPKHQEERGYVKIVSLPASSSDDKDEDAADETTLSRIAPLVSSLLERGYSPKDIAVLVDYNQQGKDVIESFVRYNSGLDSGCRPIEFISEESLLVSSAESVAIIVNVLDHVYRLSMESGVFEANARKSVKWETIRSNFCFYALRNSDKTPSEQVMSFINEGSPDDAITAMLSDMQSTALPALVESIVDLFVPESLRVSEAVFIAGFQDLVLDFIEGYPADVGMFLQWWRIKGCGKSISSPEGTDAVQIMTIHKSKGLEFKCVIVPFADGSVVPGNHSEWRWVAPTDLLSDYSLPSFLPVETKSTLQGTEHEELYNSYHDLYMLDILNKYYVAFTRAKDELYIFDKIPKRDSENKMSHFLRNIRIPGSLESDGESDEQIIEYGVPVDSIVLSREYSEETVQAEETAVDMKCGGVEHIIESYRVNSSPGILHYVEDDDESSDPQIKNEDEDSDPRSRGTLLHWVMENIVTEDDVPLAFARLRMKGVIDDVPLEEWRNLISNKIRSDKVIDWFSPKWVVMNERPVFISRRENVRPDRIMISEDGKSAIIVDYKFGEERHDNKYSDQISEYVSFFSEASGIKNVKGYVWYVILDEMLEVR